MNKNLRSIKAAMFDCPKDFNSSREYYVRNLQQKIDDTFEWASDNFEIGQEIEFGTLKFSPLVCRVTQAIHPKTGHNRGDDYRELRFLNTADRSRVVGRRYEFDGQIWLAANTDNYSYSTKQSVVRRCNNEIRYIDQNGKICSEPCIIDYTMKYSNVYFNNEVNVPQGTIIVITQNNDFTKTININDRFIFGDTVFKMKSEIDFLRNETEEIGSTKTKSFEMYVDSKSPDDDFELGIANIQRFKDVYPPKPVVTDGFKITPTNTTILQGRTVTFECFYITGSNQTNEKFTFSPNWKDDTFYSISVIDGNHFQITNNHMAKNKPLIIRCKNDSRHYDITIKLGGLF